MKGPATRICVRYKDEVIEHYHAADTIEDVIIMLIEEFGKEKVMQADQSLRSPHKQRLVTTSSTEFRTYGRYQNLYISRDRGNGKKKQILEDIARILGISMIIEVVSK